ncbi:MAG TPA: radical SAM protein [Vicinamibacterales bacterium]
MSTLMQRVWDRALDERVPLSVQFDLTYRCNERCVHCYLDHDDHGELTTAEVKSILDQLASAGTLFLIFSGGELLLRKDLFELLGYARALGFDVKLKTNAILLGEREADRLRDLGIRSVQVSIYSHRPEVHDAITKVPGSLNRSLAAIRFLRTRGLHVLIANVLMRQNAGDYPHVRALAAELGVDCTIDPTITPKMDGDTSILNLRISEPQLLRVYTDKTLIGDSTNEATDEEMLDASPCSAGHTACYISPYGDVFPCVQFPLPTGNLRGQRFNDVWHQSPEMNEVRAIRMRDLPTCSTCSFMTTCTRCPGLAYMEGNMKGPSSADCEKSTVRARGMAAGKDIA